MMFGENQLYIRQIQEWAEIIVDFETANKYQILDEAQRKLGMILERDLGFWTSVGRIILRSHRPFAIEILDASNQVLLNLSRSFFFLFSSLNITEPDGRLLGRVERRWGVIHKQYDLIDETGRVFARIKSPIWRLWTFPVFDKSGLERASISKKWGGLLSEALTDADTFQLDFTNHPWTDSQRATILGAAISIDFDFFEDNQSRS